MSAGAGKAERSMSNKGRALELAKRGIPVFPCRNAPGSDGDKRPLTANGFKDATTDPETVSAWWDAHPEALIGMPTGAPSGRIVVDLDIDKATGRRIGEESIKAARLEHLFYGAPKLRTQSGGLHYYFADDGSTANATNGLRAFLGLPREAKTGVDVRGNGGYVILADGVRYRMERTGSAPAFPAELKEAIFRRPSDAPKLATGHGARAPGFSMDFGPRGGASPSSDMSLGELEEILAHIPPPDDYSQWLEILTAIHSATGGSTEGEAIADAWCQRGTKYREGEVQEKWRSFKADGGVGKGTIAYHAKLNGADLATISRRHRPQEFARPMAGAAEAIERQSRFFSAASLKGQPVPPREWLVEGLIPQNTVTLLSGDGGTGKSLLTLQLAVAVSAAASWIGRTPQSGSVIYMSAEDDEAELHRRLNDILEAGGLSFDDLGVLMLRSLAGEDALLAHDSSVSLVKSPLFAELEALASEITPRLVVIDTLADVYPANENDRAKVRQFIGILRGLAIRQRCAVVLLAHPSLSGLMSGSGSSGSTGWNNSVRSRLYMSRILEDGREPDPNARVLTTMKANYGPTGGEIQLKWRAGAFVAESGGTGLDRVAASAKAERVFLKLLDEVTAQGRNVSAQPSNTYAPTIFAGMPGAEGCNKRALRAAMEALFHRGAIKTAKHGSGAKERSHIARAQGCNDDK